MKIKEVHYYCDVCNEEYANSEIKYKVKSRYRCRGRWYKFSVCQDCYDKFVRMGEKAKEGKNAGCD